LRERARRAVGRACVGAARRRGESGPPETQRQLQFSFGRVSAEAAGDASPAASRV
jgi:hypothetical protein